MEKDWIKLETYPDEHIAGIVSNALREAGIETILINKKDSVYVLIGEVELYCHLSQAHRALEIIEKGYE